MADEDTRRQALKDLGKMFRADTTDNLIAFRDFLYCYFLSEWGPLELGELAVRLNQDRATVAEGLAHGIELGRIHFAPNGRYRAIKRPSALVRDYYPAEQAIRKTGGFRSPE